MVEGTDAVAVVRIKRDVRIYSGKFTVHYATSDLTATGVDSIKFATCLQQTTMQRGSSLCGDYQQTSGLLTFQDGAESGEFEIGITNDLCKERFMKYIQVSINCLSVCLPACLSVCLFRLQDLKQHLTRDVPHLLNR